MARLVVNEGFGLGQALQRAAQEAGIRLPRGAPPLQDLRATIESYRTLFHPEQAAALRQLRQRALEAMRQLIEFEPRLFGPAIHGDGPLDLIRLLLKVQPAEKLMMHLDDRHIPWQSSETPLNFGGGRQARQPGARFMAGDQRVELVILDAENRSDPPRDPIGGGPLEMLDIEQLSALLDERTGS